MSKAKTILIVDDEINLHEYLKNVLAPSGYRLLFAASGEAALKIIRDKAQDIDLLLTDVILPALKGHELAKLASRTRPEMKILYMSGFMCLTPADGVPVKLEKIFLPKPFTPATVKKLIRDTLKEH